jgi:hypothetical protein
MHFLATCFMAMAKIIMGNLVAANQHFGFSILRQCNYGVIFLIVFCEETILGWI